MDSCEDRLESLKVLYDAGILDREEYAQRVARVKQSARAERQCIEQIKEANTPCMTN